MPGIAVGIVVVTLTLVLWRPRRPATGWSASGGATELMVRAVGG